MMTAKFQKHGRVAPRTVTRVSEGTVGRQGTRQKRQKGRAAATPLVSILVDPRVWPEALRVAGGDRQRITVERSESCIVWNSPEHRKEMERRANQGTGVQDPAPEGNEG